MQTFVPELTFSECARVLDPQRLNKQITECGQIAAALKPTARGWKHHTATLMWRGYEPALCQYRNVMMEEWIRRGYNNNRPVWEIKEPIVMPHWWGGIIHITHRSNLLRKAPQFYRQFNWTLPDGSPVPDDLDYFWPRRKNFEGIVVDLPEPKIEDFV